MQQIARPAIDRVCETVLGHRPRVYHTVLTCAGCGGVNVAPPTSRNLPWEVRLSAVNNFQSDAFPPSSHIFRDT